jgi:hypothetical protein
LQCRCCFAAPLQAQEICTGTVKQNIGSTDYTVVMSLSGSGGETNYPELDCGGMLTCVAESGAYSFYVEKITRRGNGCIDGAITLVSADGALVWGWVGVYRGRT